MNNIIENSLIMAVLIALVCIPVYWIKFSTKKQRRAYLASTLNKISDDHDFRMQEQDVINNLLIATDQQRLLLFNILDHSYKFYPLEEIMAVQNKSNAQQNINNIALLLKSRNGEQWSIDFYRQYTDSESSVKKAQKLLVKWKAILEQGIKSKE